MTANFNLLWNNREKTAIFDARAFTIPKEEVANYFLWRYMDWKRNSIQMVGHANFSHKELHKKSTADIFEMLKSNHLL